MTDDGRLLTLLGLAGLIVVGSRSLVGQGSQLKTAFVRKGLPRGAGVLFWFDPPTRRTDLQSRVLLLERSNLVGYAGTFGIPGGLVEPHETTFQAAFRESMEEIGRGIDAHNGYYVDGDYNYTTYVVRLNQTFTPRLNNEHTGFVWMDIPGVDRFASDSRLHPGFANAWNRFLRDAVLAKW